MSEFKRNYLRSGLIVFVLVLSATLVRAEDAPSAVVEAGPNNELTQELFQVTGLQEQITAMPDFVAAMEMAQFQTVVGEDVRAKIETAIKESYNVDDLMKGVLKDVNENFDQKRYTEIVAAMKTPLAAKMVRMEIDAQRPEMVPQMQAFFQEMGQNPPSQDRVALILRLIQGTKSDKMALEIAGATALETAKAINASVPAAQQKPLLPDEQFKANYRIQGKSQVIEQVMASMLFTYRQATDEELQQYVTIYESGNFRWFTEIITRSLVKVMEDSAKRLSKQLVVILSALNAPVQAPAPAEEGK